MPSILFKNISRVMASALPEAQTQRKPHCSYQPPFYGAFRTFPHPAQDASALHLPRAPTSCTCTPEAEPPAHRLSSPLAYMHSRAPPLLLHLSALCTEHRLHQGQPSALKAPQREPSQSLSLVTHIVPIFLSFSHKGKKIPYYHNWRVRSAFDQTLTRFWFLFLPNE